MSEGIPQEQPREENPHMRKASVGKGTRGLMAAAAMVGATSMAPNNEAMADQSNEGTQIEVQQEGGGYNKVILQHTLDKMKMFEAELKGLFKKKDATDAEIKNTLHRYHSEAQKLVDQNATEAGKLDIRKDDYNVSGMVSSFATSHKLAETYAGKLCDRVGMEQPVNVDLETTAEEADEGNKEAQDENIQLIDLGSFGEINTGIVTAFQEKLKGLDLLPDERLNFSQVAIRLQELRTEQREMVRRLQNDTGFEANPADYGSSVAETRALWEQLSSDPKVKDILDEFADMGRPVAHE